MTAFMDDLMARTLYAALQEGRDGFPTWNALPDHRRERFRRAADAMEIEMARRMRPPSRVVAMRTRTAVVMDTEETGT